MSQDWEDMIAVRRDCISVFPLQDRLLVRDTLEDNFYNVDSSVDAILAIMSVSNGTQGKWKYIFSIFLKI
jgi:hypothetical protein